jgi:hypothetical protein
MGVAGGRGMETMLPMVCDQVFRMENTRGSAAKCFRYHGEALHIVRMMSTDKRDAVYDKLDDRIVYVHDT